MFLDNKYTKIYGKLIARACARPLPDRSRKGRAAKYFEKHHIQPKALGGQDIPENYAYLTAHEHFIAHLLLPKMTTGNDRFKMLSALNDMLRIPKNMQGKRYVPTGRTYEIARKAAAEAHRGNDEIAAKISAAHIGKVLTEEHKAKICANSNRGKSLNLTAEQKAARSAKQKGKPKSESACEKMKEAWVARRVRKANGLETRSPMSEQARLNISIAKTGTTQTTSHRNNISIGINNSELYKIGIVKRESNRKNGLSYTKPRRPPSEQGLRNIKAAAQRRTANQQNTVKRFAFLYA